jgi:hypothetical protein
MAKNPIFFVGFMPSVESLFLAAIIMRSHQSEGPAPGSVFRYMFMSFGVGRKENKVNPCTTPPSRFVTYGVCLVLNFALQHQLHFIVSLCLP